MLKPELSQFAQFIEGELGIVYSEANLYQLEHRLERIMHFAGLQSLGELWQKARGGADRMLCNQILDASTNNETSFFRDKHVFQAFEETALPEALKNNSTKTIRIWSAACSTGQEPYTLSMVLHDAMVKLGIQHWELLATDFSERALERAKSGRYSQLEVQRGLSASRLIKNFDKLPNDEWVVKSHLRTNIKFQRLNLLDCVSIAEEFDIIFLRNMLIYQSVQNKQKIVEGVSRRLKSKGSLFLGGAESLMGISDAFDQVSSQGAYFYRKKK